MKKIPLIFFYFIILSSLVTAQKPGITQKIADASIDVENFFDSIPHEDITIVMGSQISVEDKILFNLIKSNINYMKGIAIIDDNHIKETNTNLVLIGSEKTNSISKGIASQLIERSEKDYSPLILDMSMNGDKKVLMIYSKKEKTMLQNNAIKKSPLNKIVDEKYVPAAATFLSILMLYLWQVFGATLIELFNETVSSKLMDHWSKKKKILKHEFVNSKEIIAFVIFVLIFSFISAYNWSTDFQSFMKLFWLNLLIIGVISLIREFARLRSCHVHKLKSEYVFWPFGSLITIISTFLGNTFSLVSYTLLDEDEEDIKKFGKSSFAISFYTFLFAIIAYLLNIFLPNVILQMIFVFCIMIVFIELLPMNPMPGYDVKKWNFTIWLVSYIVVLFSYIFMNFTVYV